MPSMRRRTNLNCISEFERGRIIGQRETEIIESISRTTLKSMNNELSYYKCYILNLAQLINKNAGLSFDAYIKLTF